jgi:hypothetical protein
MAVTLSPARKLTLNTAEVSTAGDNHLCGLDQARPACLHITSIDADLGAKSHRDTTSWVMVHSCLV